MKENAGDRCGRTGENHNVEQNGLEKAYGEDSSTDGDVLVENGVVYYQTDWTDSIITQTWTGRRSGTDNEGSQMKVEDENKETVVGIIVRMLQNGVVYLWRSLVSCTKGYLVNAFLLIGFLVYFIVAMIYEKLESEGSIRLLVCTVFGIIVVTRHYWMVECKRLFDRLHDKAGDNAKKLQIGSRWFFYLALFAVMLSVVIVQGIKDTRNLRPVLGLFLMLLVCLILSSAPSYINWHTIYWSVGLQFIFSLLVLKWDSGRDAMEWAEDRFSEFYENTVKGSVFVFGPEYTKHYIVFNALPTLLFINAVIAVLYHVGAMRLVIKGVGTVLRFVLGTSRVESTGVAASIFLDGPTSLISIRPYLGMLTRSQLFLLSTAVYSSLGGSYMAVLSALKVKVADIIPAMIISAPATFAICKLLMPETRQDSKGIQLDDEDAFVKDTHKKTTNILEVIRLGAVELISAITQVVAIVFVFYSLLSWVNHTLGWFGDRVGIDRLSIETIFSYVLYPLAYFMGVESDDCRRVAMLLGYRIGGNTIIAFQELYRMNFNRAVFDGYMNATANNGTYSHDGDDFVLGNGQRLLLGFINERSERIVTYSLCGFSSIASIGINIGVLAVLIPRRKDWLTRTSGIALIAGNLANCMTGAFAGLFYYN